MYACLRPPYLAPAASSIQSTILDALRVRAASFNNADGAAAGAAYRPSHGLAALGVLFQAGGMVVSANGHSVFWHRKVYDVTPPDHSFPLRQWYLRVSESANYKAEMET